MPPACCKIDAWAGASASSWSLSCSSRSWRQSRSGGSRGPPPTRARPRPSYGEPVDLGIPAAATDATIEYVHDGDTLFLTDGRKVRLLGVDTPEIGDNLECYGDEATALLRSMLPEGTHVRVLADAQPLDQYDRSLLLLWLDDATFVNLELIEQGAAEAVVLEPNLLYAVGIRSRRGCRAGCRSRTLGRVPLEPVKCSAASPGTAPARARAPHRRCCGRPAPRRASWASRVRRPRSRARLRRPR